MIVSSLSASILTRFWLSTTISLIRSNWFTSFDSSATLFFTTPICFTKVVYLILFSSSMAWIHSLPNSAPFFCKTLISWRWFATMRGTSSSWLWLVVKERYKCAMKDYGLQNNAYTQERARSFASSFRYDAISIGDVTHSLSCVLQFCSVAITLVVIAP